MSLKGRNCGTFQDIAKGVAAIVANVPGHQNFFPQNLLSWNKGIGPKIVRMYNVVIHDMPKLLKFSRYSLTKCCLYSLQY